MSKNILIGLIIFSTVIYTFVYINLQAYSIAASVVALGGVWLFLHIRNKALLDSLFFMFFVGFAVVGSLRNVSVPLMLLSLIMSMAAWNLARLQARIRHITDDEAKLALELNHMQKLGFTSGVGFLLALIPLAIQFSINFVIFVFMLLIVMILLRQAVVYLRNDNKTDIDVGQVT